MLGAPPPGYSPFAINRQTVQPHGVPGIQGMTAQGYNPSASSYSAPSSMPGMPGQGPAPSGAGPGRALLHQNNMAALMRALGGR